MLMKDYRMLYLKSREFFNSEWNTYSPEFGTVEIHAKLRVDAGSRFFHQGEETEGFQAYVRYYNAQESFLESALSFVYLGKNMQAKLSFRMARKCLLKAIELANKTSVKNNSGFAHYPSPKDLLETFNESRANYLAINREQTRRRLCKEKIRRVLHPFN